MRDGPDGGLLRTLRALVGGTTHLVALIEPDGTIVHSSPSVSSQLGWSPDELVGTNVLDILHPDDQGMAISMLSQPPDVAGSSDGGPPRSSVGGEYRLRHADGHWVPFEVFANDFTGDPHIGGQLVIAREVVARRALDDALTALAHDDEGTDALCMLAHYLDVRIPGTASAFLIAGGEEEWITASVPPGLHDRDGPWREALITAETVVVPDLLDGGALVVPALQDGGAVVVPDLDGAPDDRAGAAAAARGFISCWAVPLPVRRPQVYSPGRSGPDDTPVHGCLVVWSRLRPEPLGADLGVIERIGGLADVALRRRIATRRLRDLVVYDHVTGALSRAEFEGLCHEAADEPAMLVLIDLDDFKMVNDRFGHPVGDRVLRHTVQRIQSLLRPGDLLGRLGGDEFVLRVAGADLAVAEAVSGRIVAAVEAPFADTDATARVRASLGIAPWDPTVPYRELVARADVAMYVAKRAGKGQWRVWQPAAP